MKILATILLFLACLAQPSMGQNEIDPAAVLPGKLLLVVEKDGGKMSRVASWLKLRGKSRLLRLEYFDSNSDGQPDLVRVITAAPGSKGSPLPSSHDLKMDDGSRLASRLLGEYRRAKARQQIRGSTGTPDSFYLFQFFSRYLTKTVTNTPAVTSRPPKTLPKVGASPKKIKASTMVSATESLSIGATRLAWPSCRAL